MVGRGVVMFAVMASACSGASTASAKNETGEQQTLARNVHDEGSADAEPWGPRPLRLDGPEWVVGAGLGAARYHRIDNGSSLGFGPVIDARVGIQLFPWAAVHARFWGMRHESIGSVVMHAESAEARISYPGSLRPYVSVGVGRYDVVAYDSNGNQAASPDAASAVPMSAGLEAVVDDSLGLQAESTYWLLFGQEFSRRHVALASVWGATVGARYYF